MSANIKDIIRSLERLPAEEQEAAARFVDALTRQRRERRHAMLKETAGSLAGKEGEGLEEAIANCSHTNDSDWQPGH